MDDGRRGPEQSVKTAPHRRANGLGRELALVLGHLRDQGAATRSTVSRDTGLSRSVVTQRVADLQELGIVIDRGIEASSGGRPPRQVQFNAKLGHLLVADVSATSIDVAIADLNGAIMEQRAEEADVAAGPERILGRIEQLFDELEVPEVRGPGALWGIGVGVPGPVEFSTGRPVAPPIMPGWDDYPVRERLAERFSAPVWVDNDVNAMALGERAEGYAQAVDDFVFIKIGTGIGAGIVSHGQLQRGAQGSAGDVGHIQVVVDQSVVCRCGKVGCLEAIAGGAALARLATRATERDESHMLQQMLAERGVLSAREVAEAAQHGDPTSVQLLRSSGQHIGHMLATAVNILNPSLIVVGGGVAAAGDVLMASIREIVYGRSLALATRNLQIRQSTLGERATVLGLAAMVLDEIFTPDRVACWLEAGLRGGRPIAAFY